MAYTLFPKTTAEIIKNCSKSPDKAGDIVELFSFLKKKFKQVETPINIDIKVLGIVNVSRELQGMIEMKDIIREAKLTKIKKLSSNHLCFFSFFLCYFISSSIFFFSLLS